MTRLKQESMTPVYAAARRFVASALQSDDSLFTPGRAIWAEPVLKDFRARFVDRPDTSKDSFETKFHRQLKGAPPETIQLAAEMLFVYFLASRQVGFEGKRNLIELVLSWSTPPEKIPPDLLPALRDGVSNPGMSFNTRRPMLLWYLVDFADEWKRLGKQERNQLLQDPWAFREFVFRVPSKGAQTEQHALLHLVHPDTFEPITSEAMKRRIGNTLDSDSTYAHENLDRRLLLIREKLAPDHGNSFSFYDPPVRELWDKDGEGEEDEENGSIARTDAIRPPNGSRRYWVEKTLVRGEPDREKGDHALGKALWSPQTSKDGKDIYRNMHAVSPGDVVFHFVDNERIAGVSRVAAAPDTHFIGLSGTDWEGRPAIRIQLQDFVELEPPLLRNELLRNPAFQSRLRAIVGGHKNLFFNKDLALNQGAFLTAAPPALVEVFNEAYRQVTGRDLPYIEADDLHGQGVWQYAPGPDADHWDEFYRNGIMAIGWDEMGDLSRFETQDAVRQRMIELYEGEADPKNNSKTCFDFAQTMQVGDLVFAKQGITKIVGYGTITGDYVFDANRAEYKNVRAVNWQDRGEWPIDGLSRKTVTNITNPDFIARLKKLVELIDPIKSLRQRDLPPYSIDNALDGLFIERHEFESILGRWKRQKNLIVQGPPGVGKTFFSKRLAFLLMGHRDDSRLDMVQFHQSYSYEDFVQGYRPSGEGFALKNGPFYRFCKRAANEPDATYVFIIDEINRGNLSKIFGDLMMLIEGDKRGSEWAIPLTYAEPAQKAFQVPENLYLLGLMNTADRSLAMVDYALRRRFAFHVLKSQIGSARFRQYLAERRLEKRLVDALVERLTQLNDEIASDKVNLGPGFCIGHSFFCSERADVILDAAWYRGVIEGQVGPLLHEYWFDDSERADKWKQRLLQDI